MKTRAFIMFFSLITAISLGFTYRNQAYAEPCPVNQGCISCIQNKHDCCKHCKKDCKDCKDCCEKCNPVKAEPKCDDCKK